MNRETIGKAEPTGWGLLGKDVSGKIFLFIKGNKITSMTFYSRSRRREIIAYLTRAYGLDKKSEWYFVITLDIS